MNSIRLLAFLFLLWVLALAAPVGAQPADPPSDPAVEAALDTAFDKFEAGDVGGALSALEAVRGKEDPRVLATLGAFYQHAGRQQEALQALEPLIAQGWDEPAVFYNAGLAAVALHDGERAVRYLSTAAQLAPDSPATRELGLLYGRLGRFVDAYPHLRAWASQNPEDEEVRLVGALAAVQLERAPDAERFLSDLPQDDPGVKLLWAQTLMLRADPYGALGYLRPLVGTSPSAMDKDIRRTMARAYLMVGESQNAVDLLDGHVGDDATLGLLLAQALYQGGKVDAAISAISRYAEELAKAPDPARAGSLGANVSLEYGRLLLTAGRAKEALRYLEITTSVRPSEKQGWQLYAQALAADGRQADAKQALTRFEELANAEPKENINQNELDVADPTSRTLRLALALVGQDKAEESAALLRRELTIAPQDPRPGVLLSRILLLALKRPIEALEIAERTLTSVPGDAGATYQRGAALMELRRLDEAESAFRQVMQTDPTLHAALNDLAVLLMDKKRYGEAKELLERALTLRPSDPAVLGNLERLKALMK